MPTLEEIARLSNSSRSTVSRVINNDPGVRPETRARVMAVVERLNFQPNAAARSLAVGRTHILGIVIPMGVASLFTDPYFPILIQGISTASAALDYSVMLWIAEPEYERRTIGQIMGNGLIDGVIVSSMLTDDPLLQALRHGELPFVLAGRHPTDRTVHYVDVDNVNGAQAAVAHFLRLGYRRVATISGPENMIAGADRLQGYRAALQGRGIVYDSSLVATSDFSEAGGYAAMQHLLAQAPEAVFVASDTMALGALRALREAGKQVPQDVALAGFDDLPAAATTQPPLTTVRQPVLRMGSVLAEILIDLIEHPASTPYRVMLPTELVIRESCGAGLRM